MNLKDRVRRRLETETPSLIDLSQTIHGHLELAYEEVRSSASLATALEEGGLNVERRVYGLETAFGRRRPTRASTSWTAVNIATTPRAIDRLREEFAHPTPDSSLRL